MIKKILIGIVLVCSVPFLMAAAGVGVSSWTAISEALTGTDLIGVTDVSDTTGSDDGTSKRAPLSAVLTYIQSAISLSSYTGTLGAGAGGFSVDADGDVTANSIDTDPGDTYRALTFKENTADTNVSNISLHYTANVLGWKNESGSDFVLPMSPRSDNEIPMEPICVALSDESTDLTTGTAKRTIRAPYAFTLESVRASVATAPTGADLQIDVNEGGTSIFSTVLSIDASEKTSTTATTAAVISDSSIADDAELTFDIDQIGSTVAGAGAKVCLYGYR